MCIRDSPNGYYYDTDIDPAFFNNSDGTWVLEICDLVSDGHEVSINNFDIFFCAESYSCDEEDIVVDGTLIQSSYVAQNSLHIGDASPLTDKLVLQAGDEIKLNNNFEVPNNKTLEAYIDTCPSLGTSCDNSLAINLGLFHTVNTCLLYTSPSPRDRTRSRMPSSA